MKIPRSIHAQIRQACSNAGWEVFGTYNDKRKDGSRRLSYARNGWPVPATIKAAILKEVAGIVDQHEMKGATVYWWDAHRPGYGSYDKLCINVPAQEAL